MKNQALVSCSIRPVNQSVGRGEILRAVERIAKPKAVFFENFLKILGDGTPRRRVLGQLVQPNPPAAAHLEHSTLKIGNRTSDVVEHLDAVELHGTLGNQSVRFSQ